MVKGKYNRDYRLIEEFRENGRVHTDYEYIGDPWFFRLDEEIVEKEKKTALSLALLDAAAFVAALIPYSGMMHRLWIALPFAVTVIPIFMMGDLMLSAQKWKNPMEHRNADKLNNSFPARALAIAYLSLAALAGEAVYLVQNGFAIGGDKIVVICTAVMFWSALMLFRKRDCFKTEVKQDAVK